MLSFPHLVVLFLIALVVFGPQKLPELARMLGKATAEFRKMTNDFRYALEDEVRELDRQNRIREQEAAAAVARAAQPEPTPAAAPEGSVPRVIPETTVTAADEPPVAPPAGPQGAESENETGPAPHENSSTSQADTEPVSVQHETSTNDHVA